MSLASFHIKDMWSCVLNCFMLSSLPCFYAFCWSSISTSCYIFNVFNVFLFLFLYNYTQKPACTASVLLGNAHVCSWWPSILRTVSQSNFNVPWQCSRSNVGPMRLAKYKIKHTNTMSTKITRDTYSTKSEFSSCMYNHTDQESESVPERGQDYLL